MRKPKKPDDLVVTETNVAVLQAASTESLKIELARALDITARHLTHVAAIWQELERRGEDMSHLRSGLWAYMPLIASGRLRAEIVVQYAGHSMLLRRLAELPTEDQDALLRDKTVLVVDHFDGEWTERRVPITHLRATEMAQVIGDRIKPAAEQRRAALARSRKEARPKHRDPLVTAISALPSRTPNAATTMAALRLSAAQREALNRASEQHGISIAKLTIAALIVAGVIPQEVK